MCDIDLLIYRKFCCPPFAVKKSGHMLYLYLAKMDPYGKT